MFFSWLLFLITQDYLFIYIIIIIMVNLPWFIPQKRNVVDTNDYEVIVAADKSDITGLQDGFPTFQTNDGKFVKVKEFRDESKRPWWKFFDEFEYRETTSASEAHKWYNWYEPGTSAAEKKLLWKLDILIAFYSFLSYFSKFVDQTNINQAYVSGMKEDLGMKGNDLIHTQVLFTVGTIILEIPISYLLPRIPSNYLLFSAELGWSVFTIFTYSVKSVPALKGLRFCTGFFEGAFFPTIQYVLASWYKTSEISRRGALFYSGQFLGVLTAALIQGAVYDSMNGVDGLAGWRWCFIVDGLMSLVVAIIGLIVLPGTPFSCYSIWLTDDEILLARKRMYENGTDSSDQAKSYFDKETWKKVFSSWHIYLFGIMQFLGYNTNNTSSGSFVLWLKSLDKYSIGKINNLSAAAPAVGILYIIIVCFGADLTRKRFAWIAFSHVMNFVGNCILSIWDVPSGAKWFAFLSSYWSWSNSSVYNPMIYDFYRADNNVRSIAWNLIYLFGLQSSAWMNLLVWPTVEAPRFKTGFSVCASFSLAFIFFLIISYYLYKRDSRREALEFGIYIYNSNYEGVPEFVKQNGDKAAGKITSDSDSEISENGSSDSKASKDLKEVVEVRYHDEL
ncbi:hypothetical protein DASC09_038550 [Saccharomycopsis crataegensis]|uniref:Transporter SEO1 n=1 Tax=Saccharomycopsis crataegensis TaxID=43959 RepID=A0AAV5QQF7_9ASCO|nr:hypothetical protein DASC09_038550 [Saccharomycopsis crataegensis]